MSIYENYKIDFIDNSLLYSYIPANNKQIFNFSVDNNKSFVKITAPEYTFLNSTAGFTSANDSITYQTTSNYFTGNVKIDGLLKANEYDERLVLLDTSDYKIPLNYLPNTVREALITVDAATGIGIGTNKAETSLHMKYGDAYIETGRLGIGAKPSYNFHLNKNDSLIGIPAFVISSNNKRFFSVYTEKQTVVINDNENSMIIDSNIKLNVNGLTQTSSLYIPNCLSSSNDITTIHNTLAISNLTSSSSNRIIINSNVDIVFNNKSMKESFSNITNIESSLRFFSNITLPTNANNNEFSITNNSNKLIINSNNIIINNLITSNINLINYDSLTSNPYKDSVFDIKGKIRLYNDTSNIISKIYMNNTNLFILTLTQLITYNISAKTFATQNINLNNAIIRVNDNSFAYYLNNNIYLNNTNIINIDSVIDFAITDRDKKIYVINNDGILKYYDIQVGGSYNNPFNYSLSTGEKIIKINAYSDYYDNNAVVLTNTKNLYALKLGNLTFTSTLITGLTGTIIDFTNGDGHTIVLTTDGVFSFGSGPDNTNNNKFFRGYQLTQTDTSTTHAKEIISLRDKSIIGIKANKNSSIVIDNKGFVYIFGYINRLYASVMIYKIEYLSNIIDFACNNDDVFLLSYFNDIFTLADRNTNNTSILILPESFYGISIKSRGSIVIGGNNFYNLSTSYIPKNSLLVENYVGIGSNIIGNSNYSLIVSGNINIQNGSIFSNGQPFISSTSTSSSSSTIITTLNYWDKINTNISYMSGNIGIGIRNPTELLHINGNAIIESNLYIKGKIITDEYKPFIINEKRDIYYNGKLGINNITPKSSFDLYDGDFKITNVIKDNNSSIILNSEGTIDYTDNTANTPYNNPIAINSNANLIISSYYNDSQKTNNTIEIYKYSSINNRWDTYNIIGIPLNINFGQSFAMSDDGSIIYIGSFKSNYNIDVSFTSGIYEYTFDNTNQIIQSPIISYYQTLLSSTIIYNIGVNIACSGDGLILISTIYNYNKLLYINNKKTGLVTHINFVDYDKYHDSFINYNTENRFRPKIIYIDTDYTGNIIIINYLYHPLSSGISISAFAFFNFYIIRNNIIYFLKFPIGYPNSYVTSININSKGTRLFITTESGNHFIYDADFINLNYKTTRITNINIDIRYFDLSPSYIINLKDPEFVASSSITTYRGKMAKSGNNIYLSNYKKIVNFKFDNINNTWVSTDIISGINDDLTINNYSYGIDYNGYKLALSYIYKLNDGSGFDTIKLSNRIINIYKEQQSFYLYNSNLNININTHISSNLYVNKIFGNGENISNIKVNNIRNIEGINQLVFINSEGNCSNSSNLLWTNSNNELYIKGLIKTDSNIESYSGSIISGNDMIAKKNLYIHSNVYALSNIYVNSNMTVNSNIIVNANIYGNSDLIINYNIEAKQSISTVFNSITSGRHLIATSNISTTYGSITSASNIITTNGKIESATDIKANSNISTIYGSIISGNNIETQTGFIKSAGDIIASNNIIGYSNLYLTSNLELINGKLISKFDIETLQGNVISQSNIIGKNDLIIDSNIRTVYGSITSALNVYANYFYGDGSNISNLNFANISGGGNVSTGGTGRTFLNSNGLLIGNGNNSIIITSNLLWDNETEELIFSNNAKIIIKNTAPIINIPFLSNSHFSECLNIKNGGTGNSNYNHKSILFYSSNSSNFLSSSNLYWSDDTNSLYVNGYIYGDGSNISNINSLNIIDKIGVSKGGTGNTNFNIGNILIGNGTSELLSTSNLNWNSSTNTLNISNVNILNNLIVNGSNASNIDANKIVNIVSLRNGGLGISNINTGEFIFGFNTNRINSSSNVKWNETTQTMEINTILFSSNIYSCNFSGNGFNISNIDIEKISTILPLSKGGLGFNIINSNSFVYANQNNRLTENSNIKWYNESKKMQISGNLDIGTNQFTGNGFNITNIDATKIVGILPLLKGGTGVSTSEFINNCIVFKDNFNDKLITNANLKWNTSANALEVAGKIKTNSLEVATNSLTVVNNKIIVGIENDTTETVNLDVYGKVYANTISIGNIYLNGVLTQSNVLKSLANNIGIQNNNPQYPLDVNGTIKCYKIITDDVELTTGGSFTTSIGDISSASGTLRADRGGTGLTEVSYGRILYGLNNAEILGNSEHFRIETPQSVSVSNKHDLYINGDIKLNGKILNKFGKNTEEYSNIAGIESFNYVKTREDIIYTNSNLFIGYSEPDNYKFKVNGNMYVSGYITGLSDIRYKTNISDIYEPLNKVEQLKGIYYNLLNDDKRSIGLIAQDVEKIIPEVVYTNKDEIKSIAYQNLVALLIEAVKELNVKIKKLEEKL